MSEIVAVYISINDNAKFENRSCVIVERNRFFTRRSQRTFFAKCTANGNRAWTWFFFGKIKLNYSKFVFRYIHCFGFWLAFRTRCKVYLQNDSCRSEIVTILGLYYTGSHSSCNFGSATIVLKIDSEMSPEWPKRKLNQWTFLKIY